MKQLKIKKFGFTFIEILVVVTIIGVLVMIGSVSYSAANKKSRDGKRRADMQQIRAALEMYRADDADGEYPVAFSSLTTGGYISAIPSPPPNTEVYGGGTSLTDYETGYAGDSCVLPCSDYKLCLRLEVNSEDYCVYDP